jgi:hypothetical protein
LTTFQLLHLEVAIIAAAEAASEVAAHAMAGVLDNFSFVLICWERVCLRLGVEAICADVVASLEEAIAFFLELQRFGHGGGC